MVAMRNGVVTVERAENKIVVTMDSAPVNAIGLAMREDLLAVIDWVEAQPDVDFIILTGSGKTFAAGGDAREFDAPPVPPHLPDICNRIEACRVPWVAAINGIALGGGCELALACRYRIARTNTQIGLPEVTLGVVPGAGGTQRLPRLIGMAKALDLVATGKPVPSDIASDIGLVDAVSDDVITAALAVQRDQLDKITPVGERPKPVLDESAIAAARKLADRKLAQQIAPHKAIDLVAASASVSTLGGMNAERETFIELRGNKQARALRHLFFAERAAKAPDWLEAEAEDLRHVAIVGGGTMGAGIAYALINAGLAVTLLETDAAGVERARANVQRIVQSSRQRGLIDEEGAQLRLSRLAVTDDYSAASDCQLAIEAAFESMEVKRAVLAELETHLPADAILATNTSYLDINMMAETLRAPHRLVGLHFFAPAHVMKLLEIVRADATSDRALVTGYALAKRLRKIPVLAGVCDGFIGNRILARYREVADELMMDGAMPWQIDGAMRGFGYAMGPYEAQDLSGLDIAFANRRRQDATRDPSKRYVPIADVMVENGRLGKKTGHGWYDYSSGSAEPDRAVEDLIMDQSKRAGVLRRRFGDDEIADLLITEMINEAKCILEEGIALSATDIDLVSVLGYGFPRWRGGLMFYAQHAT